MTLYTVRFTNDKISARSRKMPHPLSVVLLTPSLEVRLNTITALIEEAARKQRLGVVTVSLGTHGGTVYSLTDIPLSTFTIDPPLEMNG
jgi:hypothetical protein